MNTNPIFSTLEQKYNLPQGYLSSTYGIESNYGKNTGSNPNVQGPFQFTTSTAKQYGLTDPNDLTQSADAAARLAADNSVKLRGVLGRDPTGAELYLAHQQGAGGAAGLLANPDQPAGAVTNPKFIAANGGDPSASAGDFVNKWASKFNNTGQDPTTGVGTVAGPATPLLASTPATPEAAVAPEVDKKPGLLDQLAGVAKDMKPKEASKDDSMPDPTAAMNALAQSHIQAIAAMKARAANAARGLLAG